MKHNVQYTRASSSFLFHSASILFLFFFVLFQTAHLAAGNPGAIDSLPEKIYRTVDQLPTFPGGKAALFSYITENLKSPAETTPEKVHGQVLVQFVVFKDGTIGKASVLKGIGKAADEAALNLVQTMPKWIPGILKGQNVNVEMGLPIRFEFIAKGYFTQDSLIVAEVDTPAKFSGGLSKWAKYIGENLVYPESAKRNSIQGDAFVQFTIEKDGTISNPIVTKGLGYGIDEEVIKLLKSAPKWKPSYLKGEPVRTIVSDCKFVFRIY
jgi:TonB family protein